MPNPPLPLIPSQRQGYRAELLVHGASLNFENNGPRKYPNGTETDLSYWLFFLVLKEIVSEKCLPQNRPSVNVCILLDSHSPLRPMWGCACAELVSSRAGVTEGEEGRRPVSAG